MFFLGHLVDAYFTSELAQTIYKGQDSCTDDRFPTAYFLYYVNCFQVLQLCYHSSFSPQNDAVVAGGGAIEMELSRYLRDHSRTIAGKEQLLIAAMAKALEVIPRQLCDNAGFDSTNVLNKLRQKHATGK